MARQLRPRDAIHERVPQESNLQTIKQNLCSFKKALVNSSPSPAEGQTKASPSSNNKNKFSLYEIVLEMKKKQEADKKEMEESRKARMRDLWTKVRRGLMDREKRKKLFERLAQKRYVATKLAKNQDRGGNNLTLCQVAVAMKKKEKEESMQKAKNSRAKELWAKVQREMLNECGRDIVLSKMYKYYRPFTDLLQKIRARTQFVIVDEVESPVIKSARARDLWAKVRREMLNTERRKQIMSRCSSQQKPATDFPQVAGKKTMLSMFEVVIAMKKKEIDNKRTMRLAKKRRIRELWGKVRHGLLNKEIRERLYRNLTSDPEFKNRDVPKTTKKNTPALFGLVNTITAVNRGNKMTAQRLRRGRILELWAKVRRFVFSKEMRAQMQELIQRPPQWSSGLPNKKGVYDPEPQTLKHYSGIGAFIHQL